MVDTSIAGFMFINQPTTGRAPCARVYDVKKARKKAGIYHQLWLLGSTMGNASWRKWPEWILPHQFGGRQDFWSQPLKPHMRSSEISTNLVLNIFSQAAMFIHYFRVLLVPRYKSKSKHDDHAYDNDIQNSELYETKQNLINIPFLLSLTFPLPRPYEEQPESHEKYFRCTPPKYRGKGGVEIMIFKTAMKVVAGLLSSPGKSHNSTTKNKNWHEPSQWLHKVTTLDYGHGSLSRLPMMARSLGFCLPMPYLSICFCIFLGRSVREECAWMLVVLLAHSSDDDSIYDQAKGVPNKIDSTFCLQLPP